MRVLLATDGSKDAEAATAFLAELPLPPSATLRVVTIAPLPSFVLDVPTVREFKRSAIAGLRHVVDTARVALGPRGFPIETDVALGDPKAEILRIAEEWEAELIVLGARGLGKIKRFLLGSVSLAVARHARCPVMVVKGRPRKLGSVLVATDGSEDSFQAIRFLLSLPLARQTKVRLLSVVEPIRYPTSAPQALHGRLVKILEELEKERRDQLEKVLDEAAAYFDGRITRVTRSTPSGDAAETILATAAAGSDTDLVVVGSRGFGMKRLLLGSVSEKVLRHASCPILIVKGRLE